MGYDFTIQYMFGRTNVVADVLSQIPEVPPWTLLLLLMPHFAFLQELKRELSNHPKFITLKKGITKNPTTYLEHTFLEDLVMHKSRIWLPDNLKFILLLLQEFHSMPTGGHMDITKTLARLQESFICRNI